jgi:hypothetical protein
MNSAQPMLTALDAKIRQMCTVRENATPISIAPGEVSRRGKAF